MGRSLECWLFSCQLYPISSTAPGVEEVRARGGGRLKFIKLGKVPREVGCLGAPSHSSLLMELLGEVHHSV